MLNNGYPTLRDSYFVSAAVRKLQTRSQDQTRTIKHQTLSAFHTSAAISCTTTTAATVWYLSTMRCELPRRTWLSSRFLFTIHRRCPGNFNELQTRQRLGRTRLPNTRALCVLSNQVHNFFFSRLFHVLKTGSITFHTSTCTHARCVLWLMSAINSSTCVL